MFNFNRFLSVAKWDLTLNRSFYIKMALVIFLFTAIPAFLNFAFNWLLWFSGLSQYGASDPFPVANNMVCFLLLLLIPILVGFTFHNLSTRQGRVMELTLPASTLEKYLWHAIFAVFGSLLFAALSLALVDGLQAIMTIVSFGSEHVNSYYAAIYENISSLGGVEINQTTQTGSPYDYGMDPYQAMYDTLGTYATDSLNYMQQAYDTLGYYGQTGTSMTMSTAGGGGTMSFSSNVGMPTEMDELRAHMPWFAALFLSSYVTFLSTYMLGSSILYRFNIIATTGFHLALHFVMFWAMVIIAVTNIDFLWDSVKWLMWDKVGISVFIVFFWLMSAVIWLLAFLCYNRAQITSRMNR